VLGAEVNEILPETLYCPEALQEPGVAVILVISHGVTIAQSAEPAPGKPVFVWLKDIYPSSPS
jgi:hypothetical protein